VVEGGAVQEHESRVSGVAIGPVAGRRVRAQELVPFHETAFVVGVGRRPSGRIDDDVDRRGSAGGSEAMAKPVRRDRGVRQSRICV
jgi:hypothetical protein